MNTLMVWLFLTVVPNISMFIAAVIGSIIMCMVFRFIYMVCESDFMGRVKWEIYHSLSNPTLNPFHYTDGSFDPSHREHRLCDRMRKELDDRIDEGADKYEKDATQNYFKSLKTSFITVAILAFMLVLIPSRKEMIAIVAVPYVTDNAQFKQLPENVFKVLNNYIKEYLPEEQGTKEE